jgi:tetratricopeptide (TPR) repeat protein
MPRFSILLLLFLLLLGNVNAQAQNNVPIVDKDKLALSYFSSGEYSKAKEIYEELLKKNRFSAIYYENYLMCLVNLEEYKEALKFTQKTSSMFPDNSNIRIDYIWILEKSGDKKKVIKEIQSVLENQSLSNSYKALQVSSAFKKRGFKGEAIQVLLNSRQLNTDKMVHSMELADLYAEAENYSAMFGEFLQYLEVNEGYIDQIQNRLQQLLTEKVHYESLKKELVSRIQKRPNIYSYQNLLFWVFVQQKDWDGAFIQIRAIDLKTDKSGYRLLELADVCIENNAFETAIKCYQNLVLRGEEHPLYASAEIGLLKTKLTKLENEPIKNQEALLVLAEEYKRFLENKGYLPGSEFARFDLAYLYINLLHKPKQGILHLEDLIKKNVLDKTEIAKAKLMLADAYLMQGEDWESHLLYKQVEKDFKDEAIGQEAKFKFAKLSYFRGEFDWALTQLEVLKGATTQLISNNAIELALHIIESSGLDSTEEHLNDFAQAELAFFRNDTSDALNRLNKLSEKINYHELSDNILFLKSQILLKQNKSREAVTCLLEITEKYAFGLLADDALWNLGLLYETHFKEPNKAMECYEKILSNYPDSYYVFQSRIRYRNLKSSLSL